jgi:hypothetical protein
MLIGRDVIFLICYWSTGWPCSGPLLRLAEDAAQRLLPAFDTPTGMPYGTVNLR